MQNLISLTRNQAHVPRSGSWNLNHWTTREVLILILFVSSLYLSWLQDLSYILIPVGTIMVNEPFFHLQWSSYDSFMTLENRARKDSTSACDSDAGISFWSQFAIQSKMFFIFISYFSEYFELIDTRHTVFAKQNKGISVDCPEQLISRNMNEIKQMIRWKCSHHSGQSPKSIQCPQAFHFLCFLLERQSKNKRE